MAQASLSFQGLSDPPASASRVAGTTGMYCHAQPEVFSLTGIVLISLKFLPCHHSCRVHGPSWLTQGYPPGPCLAPGRKALSPKGLEQAALTTAQLASSNFITQLHASKSWKLCRLRTFLGGASAETGAVYKRQRPEVRW